MSFAILAFFSGLLTILAPCSLFLLPSLVLGGTGKGHKAWLVIASLCTSLFLLTIALKAFSDIFWINPSSLEKFSGSILVLLGLSLLFPQLWDFVQSKISFIKKIQPRQDSGSILFGASLAPVFSSCSPSYTIIVVSILPQNLALGSLYLLIFITGMAIPFIGISLLGASFLGKLKGLANPYGPLKRGLGVLVMGLGLLYFFGLHKSVEAFLLPLLPYSFL